MFKIETDKDISKIFDVTEQIDDLAMLSIEMRKHVKLSKQSLYWTEQEHRLAYCNITVCLRFCL